jgi:hypothetical protein
MLYFVTLLEHTLQTVYGNTKLVVRFLFLLYDEQAPIILLLTNKIFIYFYLFFLLLSITDSFTIFFITFS